MACDENAASGGGSAEDGALPPLRASCSRTVDCAAGLICENGLCVAPFDPPVETDGEPPDVRVWDARSPADAGARDADLDAAPIADARPDAPPLDATEPDARAERDAPVPDDRVRDAAPDRASRDATPDAAVPDAAPDAAVPDATPDAAVPDAAVADATPDAAPDLGPGPFVPPPTPPRGVYRYERVALGGLTEARAVAFHPDGAYAVVLARTDVVHVVDWATLQGRPFDLRPPGGTLYWEDLVFDPTGRRAVLVGWRIVRDVREGVVFHLDDAALRAGDPAPFTPTATVAGDELAAVAWPWDPIGRPVVLSRSNNGRVAILREYDPDAGRFAGLVAAQASGAGCQDVAFADDEFGNDSLVVACGINGAEVLHYTTIAGVGEWRRNPGNNNLGNMARIDAHRPGDYALIVSWSGRRLHRFETGLLGDTADAPSFPTRGIWGVTFQQEGQRALVYGQAGGNPLTATVFEYRHPEYHCDALTCELTEVHVPNFGAAPYNGTQATRLNDAAFRPGCDGGLLAGGETDFRASRGLVIAFQIENGRACR